MKIKYAFFTFMSLFLISCNGQITDINESRNGDEIACRELEIQIINDYEGSTQISEKELEKIIAKGGVSNEIIPEEPLLRNDLYSMSEEELQTICNYKTLIVQSFENEAEHMRLQYLYDFIISHKDTGLYVLENIDIELFSYIDKLKLYYILGREYGMNNEEAENIVGEINENHKGLYMPTRDYVFGEFMLTIDYDRYNEPELKNIPESRIVVGAREYLRYDHIKLLDIILSTEPERLTRIAIISSIQSAYETLQDNRSKELYLNMFRKFYKLDEVQNGTFKKEIERLFEDAGEEL